MDNLERGIDIIETGSSFDSEYYDVENHDDDDSLDDSPPASRLPKRCVGRRSGSVILAATSVLLVILFFIAMLSMSLTKPKGGADKVAAAAQHDQIIWNVVEADEEEELEEEDEPEDEDHNFFVFGDEDNDLEPHRDDDPEHHSSSNDGVTEEQQQEHDQQHDQHQDQQQELPAKEADVELANNSETEEDSIMISGSMPINNVIVLESQVADFSGNNLTAAEIEEADSNIIPALLPNEVVVLDVGQNEQDQQSSSEEEDIIDVEITPVDELPVEEEEVELAPTEGEEVEQLLNAALEDFTIPIPGDSPPSDTVLLDMNISQDDCLGNSKNTTSSPTNAFIQTFTGPISDFISTTDLARISSQSSNANTHNAGCAANEGRTTLKLTTDDYPWELSWTIKGNGLLYASGPPPNKNYERRTFYAGAFCLPAGEYDLVLKDAMGDGMCCAHGAGEVSVIVNGNLVVEAGRDESYDVKTETHGFMVARDGDEDDSVGDGGDEINDKNGGSNNENGNVPEVNKGGECSVVMPVDYSNKFQPGEGYQSFPGYQCYRTVDGTTKTVNDLTSAYPKLASKVFLPNYVTAENNIRLFALVITNKQSDYPAISKGKVLAVSSIHARELATGETMLRFAEYLLQNYDKDPEVTWILDYTEIHLILHGNPDGRKYLENGGDVKLWKKNRSNSTQCDHWRYGVDPNRNFPFKWGQCDTSEGADQRCSSSPNCQSVVYRGDSAKSEQETKAIVQYAAELFPEGQRKGGLQRSERKWDIAFPESSEGIFLDIHSHGRDVGWPWGWKNKNTPNNDGLGALGRKFASFGEYSLWAPQLPNRLYGFDGSTIDTMYGWLGAASFFFELGTSFYQPCDTFPTVINEVFPAFLYAAKVAKQPYIAPQGPDILCTNIAVKTRNNIKFISVEVEVSDDARIKHADDSGVFSTGRQSITLVEIFVNCHPYSGSNCESTRRKQVSNEGESTTKTLEFRAPDKRDNVIYIRATDSGGYTGPVTARSFVV